ncbi:MAG: hypothetical protein AB9869_23955 [Verrucomicrobiia bacterium]
MSHYLARLVERARGTAPRVNPIVASRFAPRSASESANEEVFAEVAGNSRPAGGIPEGPITIPSPSAAAPIEADRDTLLVPQFQPGAPPMGITEGQSIAVEEEATLAGQAQRPNRAQPRSLHTRTAVPVPRSTAPAPDPRSEAPVVRITIGRIDVRSGPESKPTPRGPVQSSSEPKLTLDAYLKSRKEGAR